MKGRRLLEQLGYNVDVDEASGSCAVRGFGVATMLAYDDDTLTVFADPLAHAERRFQSARPDAAAARGKLLAAGYTVDRVADASVDVFTVTAPGAAKTSTAPAPTTPDDLVKQAATLTTSAGAVAGTGKVGST